VITAAPITTLRTLRPGISSSSDWTGRTLLTGHTLRTCRSLWSGRTGVAAAPRVTRVEIDHEGLFPDVDRTNQVWPTSNAP